MSEITIYHNPRCSNSRNALALLRAQGVEPHIVDYLKTPLSQEELVSLMERYDGPPGDFVRFKEEEAAEQNIQPNSPPSALVAAIVAVPKLLQRPIVTVGGRVLIARPPERVLTLLDDGPHAPEREA